MKNLINQAHVKWECKYHVVILPKYRKKVLYGKIRRKIGEILRDLCRQKGVQLEEGKAMSDHIHMLLSCIYAIRGCFERRTSNIEH